MLLRRIIQEFVPQRKHFLLLLLAVKAKALSSLFGNGFEPAHGKEMPQTENGLWNVLSQIRRHHNAEERQMEHTSGYKRQRNRHQPEAAEV